MTVNQIKILALETSGLSGSVAALLDGETLCEVSLPEGQRTAQSLAPAIQGVLGEVAWRPKQVDLVVAIVGPGSFTGLRLGVTTAKAFAFAVGCPALGIDTLEAIAARVPATLRDGTDTEYPADECVVVLNAQRRQLFERRFRRTSDGAMQAVTEVLIVDNDAWIADLAASTVVTGPGLKKLASPLPEGVVVVPPNLWEPTAGVVGKLGWLAHQAGQQGDPFELVPRYFRQSAAEEKWRQQHGPA